MNDEEDNKYMTTIEYVVVSYINGQFKQCQELIKEHGHSKKDVKNYLNEYGYNAEYTLEVITKLYK